MNLDDIVISRDPLSTTERSQVEDLLQQSLNSQAQLKQQLADQERREAMCLAALSPVRVLPNDVLQEIFLHCLSFDPLPAMTASEAPLLLCRVSSSWRKIALSTPGLWSSVYILLDLSTVHPEQSPARYEAQIAYISDWLSRAGNLPLSIIFEDLTFGNDLGKYTDYYPTKEHLENVLHSLMQFSKHWGNVELTLRSQMLNLIDSMEPDDLPLLQRFKCHYDENAPFPDFGDGLYGPLLAPQLVDIDIIGPICPWAIKTVDSSCYHLLSQLTNLTLRDYEQSIAYLSQILSHCSNLENFRLDIKVRWGEEKEVIMSMSLPKLRSLYIVEPSFKTKSFFDNVEVPSLSSFTYHIKGERDRSNWTKLPPWLNILNQVHNTLESLTIEPTFFNIDELDAFLMGNTVFKRLHLRATMYTGTTGPEESHCLNRLIPRESVFTTHCPNLEYLQLSNWGQVSDDELLELLRSRAVLKKAVIQMRRTRERDILPDLPQGLEAELSYRPDYEGEYVPTSHRLNYIYEGHAFENTD